MSVPEQQEGGTNPSRAIQPDDRDLVLAFVRDRDVACPLCGYNLRGLTEPRCPECAHALALNVIVPDVPLAAWIATMIAACSSAGLGLFFAVMIIVDGFPRAAPFLFYVAITYFVAAIPGAICVVKFRKPYLRMDRSWRRLVATCVCSASAVMFIAFFAAMA